MTTNAAVLEESEIFNIKPSLKDYWGTVLLGIITIPIFGAGLVLIFLTRLSVKSVSYRMTNERLFLNTGIVARRMQEAELYRSKDLAFSQGIVLRLLGVDHVIIASSDTTTPTLTLTLNSMRNPEQVKETIRLAFRSARKSEGVKVAEHTTSGLSD